MSNNNTGVLNTGNHNTGNSNTGNSNTGNRNTGNHNTGNSNTGNSNTGNRNTGNHNTGNRNTGYRNTGYRNAGYLNTTTPKVTLFNKQTDIKFGYISFPEYFYFDLTKWVSEDSMTDEEKKENPTYKTTGGYLKSYEYKEAWKISFDEAEKEDVAKTLELPNFDYDIFEEISGISKKDLDIKLGDGIQEMTLEEICKELGRDIKVVK